MAKTKDPQKNLIILQNAIQDQQAQDNNITSGQHPVHIFPQLPGTATTNHLSLNLIGSIIGNEDST